jgi:Ca2+-binding RTX toxin-like protein
MDVARSLSFSDTEFLHTPPGARSDTWTLRSLVMLKGVGFMFGKNRRFKGMGIGLALAGASACGPTPSSSGPADEDVFDVANIHALTTNCTIDSSGNIQVTVSDNETAYFFKRAADGKVVVNTSTECSFAPNKRITVNATGSTGHKVILDYIGGTFGLGSSALSSTPGSGPNTIIDLGTGANTVAFRGTASVDTLTFGTSGSTSFATIGVGSASAASPARSYPDVSMLGITDIMAYTAGGNDIITGQGGTASGGTVSVPVGALIGSIGMAVYGGNGDDTITSGAAGSAINKLYGEAGNDRFLQQAALAHDVIDGTNAGGVSDIDIVDYSARTAALTITVGDDVTASAAIGGIQCDLQTNYANNNSFTINNGTTATVFEYKKVAMGFSPTMGRVLIDITGATSEDEVATATMSAINGAPSIGVVASTDSTPGHLVITHGTVGLKPVSSAITAGILPSGASVSDFGPGVAGVGANDGASSGEGDSVSGDIETIIGGSGNDLIDSRPATSSSHTLIGMSGNDSLFGSAMNDTLWGGPGNDTLTAGLGADTLNGGDGDDTIQGGTGDDALDGGGTNCVLNSSSVCTASYLAKGAGALNPGTNTLDYSERTSDVTIDLLHLTMSDQVGESGEHDAIVSGSFTNILGGSGNDSLSGDSSNNYLRGGDGDDIMYGLDGNDTVYGGNGDDFISGGNGNDALYGGDGDDSIYGFAGIDYISGGTSTSVGNTLDGGDDNDVIDNSAGTFGSVECGTGVNGGDSDSALLNGQESLSPNNCES